MNNYLYRHLRNGLLFFAYRVEADRLFSAFSFDENKESLSSAYDSILGMIEEAFVVNVIIQEPFEITMHQFLECIEECSWRKYNARGKSALVESANIWFYYDQTTNDGHDFHSLLFNEKMITDRKLTDCGIYNPSYLKEMKTISEHKLNEDLSGNMVHYIMSARSISAASDLAESLAQELYAAGRIASRRVGIISEIRPDLYKLQNHFEDIIENNCGGALMIDLSETFGHSPSEYSVAADYIAGIFKRG